MNQDREWISAVEAATLLAIKKETLYAYASRGLVRSISSKSGERSRLYRLDDLERLRARSRARSGHGAVAAGALRWGEPVLETRIGTIGPDGPVYRGVTALELVRRKASFEDVCALLWDAPFGAAPETLGLPGPPLRALLARSAEAFDAMLLTAAALAVVEPRGEGLAATKQRAGVLVRRLVAACALPRGMDAVASALAAEGTSRALLVALGGRTTGARVDAMTEAMVLSADHELNASTFAARVAASSGANLGAAVVAGLAALSGPLHGAASARVEALVSEVERPERASMAVSARLGRGESVPGFGHPLYPDGDPRGAHLLAAAERLAPRSRAVRVLVAVANAMHRAAHEQPNLDLGLVALAGALGLPNGSAMAIFASGRLAGWIAHVFEQRESAHLVRPRAEYVGAS